MINFSLDSGFMVLFYINFNLYIQKFVDNKKINISIYFFYILLLSKIEFTIISLLQKLKFSYQNLREEILSIKI